MARGRRRTAPIDDEDLGAAPGQTLEARENQLILLATNLAEEQLRNGTASSQVISHYLRLGTTRERLEQERLRNENALARAKTEKIQSDRHLEELFEEVTGAMRAYRGEEDYDEDGYDR